MTHTRSSGAAAPSLKMLYWPIESEMESVERILGEQMRSEHRFVDELVRYGCMLGGKRLRPALLLLTAKATGQVTQDHLTLAAVMEMIHTATLIHDDVLDEADMRRHLATVNARWDTEASVLLGDYLFTHSFYLASTLESTLACRWIGQATNTVCEGEIRQKGSKSDFSIDENEYLEIISAKTAELCACCCRLGAHYAGADEELVERMAQFGRDLGIAFQIADDLLDVAGDERSMGKSLGTDLEKRKPTLPLIRTLQVADPPRREQILTALEDNGRPLHDEFRQWMVAADALQYTRERALHFATRARAALDPLDAGPAQQVLALMTEAVVSRAE